MYSIPCLGVTPPMMSFSLDSAFYVFNLVANWAYSRFVWCVVFGVLVVVCMTMTLYLNVIDGT